MEGTQGPGQVWQYKMWIWNNELSNLAREESLHSGGRVTAESVRVWPSPFPFLPSYHHPDIFRYLLSFSWQYTFGRETLLVSRKQKVKNQSFQWSQQHVAYCSPNLWSPSPTCTRECVLSPTLCDPMDCSLSGSSVHGILQARIIQWVAILFSRRSSQSRDWICICYRSGIGRQVLYAGATWEAPFSYGTEMYCRKK